MTYAGFFVHLNDIPPVIRWLQWLCPLKYTLEALSVNEVGSGLMIQDTLQGVPVSVSAALIMQTVSLRLLLQARCSKKKTDLCGAVVRIWAEQLLQGRACALCVHRGLRDLRDLCRVAEGARAAVIPCVDVPG